MESCPVTRYPHPFEVFYDGDCPLCLREINWLRNRDRQRRIVFTDIADPGFDAQAAGKSYEELMDQIHGRMPDGRWVRGVEVFRQLYHAAGFGALTGLSRVPGVSHCLELGYRVFARYRLTLTGRCSRGTCEAGPATPASRQGSV